MRPRIKDRRRTCDFTDWRKPAAEDDSDREHLLPIVDLDALAPGSAHTERFDNRQPVRSSSVDPFEHRQVDLAQERLGKLGLQIERLPGGHLTTNEQPEALAALIAKFERGPVNLREPRSTISARRNAA